MKTIYRKSLIYKTKVEYGDYTINHVIGCSHGCKYPCYAMLMSKRFGRVKDYDEWIQPKLVANSLELIDKEIKRLKKLIKSVHLYFMTDPFMYNFPEVSNLSLKIINKLNSYNIKVTTLTKGIYPDEIIDMEALSKENEYGITVVSLDDNFKNEYEPYAASIEERISGLFKLHMAGLRTWVSIEPYPTPNIINQDISEILSRISFVDKIIFGRMNYNIRVSEYSAYRNFYNDCCRKIIAYCCDKNIEYYIKEGTFTDSIVELDKSPLTV